MAILATLLRARIAELVGSTREALGWSQAELARRAGVSQALICRLENDRLGKLTFDTAARVLDALGVKVTIDLVAPFIADGRRQRDLGHARCIAYVVNRLKRLGWLVDTEVLLTREGAFGWIDILAYRPADRTLLVIEVKTVLADIGAAMRQLAWYERDAWAVAESQGWRPRRAVGVMLVLASAINLQRLRDNRDLLRDKFALPVAELDRMVAGDTSYLTALRGLALIDPLDRRGSWLLRSPLNGPGIQPRYADYATFIASARSKTRTAA